MTTTEITANDVALAQAGDSEAKERLIARIEPLIGWWLKRVRWAGAWEEGMQEGRVGVLEALRRFDAGRGARFTTFAGWWIRQAVESAMTHAPLSVEEVPERESGMDVVVDAAAAAEIVGAVGLLPEREADLLRWRFWEEESLEAIGKRLGRHKYSVSLMIQKSLRKVRGLVGKC
jgi:RNA polymerase sigma factor (sigma-70 family)